MEGRNPEMCLSTYFNDEKYIRRDLKCFNLVEKKGIGGTIYHLSVKDPMMLP